MIFQSPSHQQEALKRRLEQTVVPEFPRHRLRMLTILAEGNFGKVCVFAVNFITNSLSQ